MFGAGVRPSEAYPACAPKPRNSTPGCSPTSLGPSVPQSRGRHAHQHPSLQPPNAHPWGGDEPVWRSQWETPRCAGMCCHYPNNADGFHKRVDEQSPARGCLLCGPLALCSKWAELASGVRTQDSGHLGVVGFPESLSGSWVCSVCEHLRLNPDVKMYRPYRYIDPDKTSIKA